MRLRTALVVAAIIALAVSGAIAAARLGSDEPPPTPAIPIGKALDFGSSWQVKGPMARGQEVIDLYGSVKNKSDVAVKLEEIRPLEGNGVPENGELLDIFIVPSSFKKGGLYNTLPPVTGSPGKCVRASIEPITGYVLGPDQSVSIGMHVRANGLGTFHLKERDFFYEQSGRRYRQRDSSAFTGRVRKDWDWKRTYAKLRNAERTCRGVRILPRPE